MKLIFYFNFLSLVLTFYGHAQQHPDKVYKDSLTHILELKTTDSIKARAGFLLSDQWSYTDTLKAKEFLELGRRFSGKNNYLQALYAFYSGQFYFDTNTRKAKRAFLKADSLLAPFTNPEAYYFRARAWHNYGAMCQIEDNDYKVMLAALTNKAVPFAIKSGNKEYLAQNYADIGLVFSNNLQYDKAKAYYDKALLLLSQTKEIGQNNNVYIHLDAIRNLLFMGKLSDAKKLIDKISPMIAPGLESEIAFLEQQGIYFIESEQFQKAINSLDKALAAAKEQQRPNLAEKILFQKYRAYKGMSKYDDAKDILLSLINNPILKSRNNRLTEYYELAETYAKLGNMRSAYKWQKEYGALLDSISKSQLQEEINKLEIKFHNVENQKKISELNAANTKAILTVKNGRLINWLLGAVSIFLLSTALIILFFYKSYKKSAAQQTQIGITKAMIQAQEEERTRIARDLHDGLGGMLTTVKLNLEDFAEGNTNNSDIALQNIINQLNGSLKELRRIARNMMPEMLLNIGLEASLKDMCALFTTKSLQIDFQCLGIQNTIRMETKITIYRIIQELLTNIVKHADAKNVLLQCAQQGQAFFITIEDDGKGFDADMLTQIEGIGLSNIKNRVAYLNGTIEILTKDQQGTSINIELHVNT